MSMAAILVVWPGPFEQLSFPCPKEDPYEIWLWLARWRRCLKIVDIRRQTTEAYLSYKLTNEPSAQVS